MSLYYRKAEKAEYEQRRRKGIIEEARNYRLMFKWLQKTYPDVLTEHYAYKADLRKMYPHRKDLTTTQRFRQFMQGESGT